MSDVNVSTQVYAKLVVEGIHNWPGCDIPAVEYLKHPHRHLFHIVAFRPVYHDDRDIEFIDFQHKIRQYLTSKYWSEQHGCCLFGAKSCEMLGRELLIEFDLTTCEVSEDNENGAVVTA